MKKLVERGSGKPQTDLQQRLQEVEQRRHDLMPEHQRMQKRSQKIRVIILD